MVKAVLFDFDGTLADSSAGIFHTALHTVRTLGIKREYSDEELRRFVGPPLRSCFSIAFGLDESLLDDAVKIYRKEYAARGMYMMELYPGMKGLLETLHERGYLLGVATFKGESLVRACLENFGILQIFDTVRGSDEVETRTKGDIIKLAVADLGIMAGQAVMVGDTVTDRAGADEAGTDFIGVGYGFGFRKGEADADSPEDILRILSAKEANDDRED